MRHCLMSKTFGDSMSRMKITVRTTLQKNVYTNTGHINKYFNLILDIRKFKNLVMKRNV